MKGWGGGGPRQVPRPRSPVLPCPHSSVPTPTSFVCACPCPPVHAHTALVRACLHTFPHARAVVRTRAVFVCARAVFIRARAVLVRARAVLICACVLPLVVHARDLCRPCSFVHGLAVVPTCPWLFFVPVPPSFAIPAPPPL